MGAFRVFTLNACLLNVCDPPGFFRSTSTFQLAQVPAKHKTLLWRSWTGKVDTLNPLHLHLRLVLDGVKSVSVVLKRKGVKGGPSFQWTWTLLTLSLALVDE